MSEKFANVGHITCARCMKAVSSWIMSMFNEDTICLECKIIEQQHPRYQFACEMDQEAIKDGNSNFKGIGWPFPKEGADGSNIKA